MLGGTKKIGPSITKKEGKGHGLVRRGGVGRQSQRRAGEGLGGDRQLINTTITWVNFLVGVTGKG